MLKRQLSRPINNTAIKPYSIDSLNPIKNLILRTIQNSLYALKKFSPNLPQAQQIEIQIAKH